MVKRIVSMLILWLMILSIAISLSGCSRTKGTTDDKSALRSLDDIKSEKIHFFDDEAIALADYSGASAILRGEALRAFNLVNDERSRNGLQPLIWDSNLESTSDVRSIECNKKFSHTRPDGLPWYTVNSNIMGGENLAFGYNTAAEVVGGWMDSPTHRDNIMYGEFSKVAISIYVNDQGIPYWAQEFGY